MRIVFVADGRSPIALNWIGYFCARGDEVHLVSTFPCSPELELASLTIAPVAFSQAAGLVWQAAGGPAAGGPAAGGPAKALKARGKALLRGTSPALRTALRQWLGPATVPGAASVLRGVLRKVAPDLVHAMRIPYEGMVAAQAGGSAPLLVSVWGNDFTLHANANPWMARRTRGTLGRAGALHTDTRRDLRLAESWGFDPHKPAVVLPGAGGIQTDLFHPPELEDRPPLVVNPRALRPYIRSDTFFRSIPLVLQEMPEARFACVAMAGQPEALRWIETLGIDPAAVDLLPAQTRPQMAELFRRARVAVSPSTHDGTPNTLLEAMACGCFPVAGDLDSIREWITPGENGLLVDPGDAQALAGAVLCGLRDARLRRRAREMNGELIAARADHAAVMEQAGRFYRALTGG